jgi:hypothetical protein
LLKARRFNEAARWLERAAAGGGARSGGAASNGAAAVRRAVLALITRAGVPGELQELALRLQET